MNEKAIFHCKCSFVSAPVFSTTVVTSTEAAITLLNSPNTHNDYKVLLLPQYLKPNPLSLQLLSIDSYCHCQKIMTHLYLINKVPKSYLQATLLITWIQIFYFMIRLLKFSNATSNLNMCVVNEFFSDKEEEVLGGTGWHHRSALLLVCQVELILCVQFMPNIVIVRSTPVLLLKKGRTD